MGDIYGFWGPAMQNWLHNVLHVFIFTDEDAEHHQYSKPRCAPRCKKENGCKPVLRRLLLSDDPSLLTSMSALATVLCISAYNHHSIDEATPVAGRRGGAGKSVDGIYIRLGMARTENKVVSGWRHHGMLLSVVGEVGRAPPSHLRRGRSGSCPMAAWRRGWVPCGSRGYI